MRFFSNKLVIFLLSLTLVLLIIFLHIKGTLKPIENLTASTVRPVQYCLNSIGNKFSNFFSTVSSISSLQKKNKELTTEIGRLNAEIVKLKELEIENKALREQLGFAQKSSYRLLPAEIIGRDPEGFFQYLIINKGKKDGVGKGMFVLSSGHLVGKVTEVYNRSAKLSLITNPAVSVGIIIQGSRATGILRGELGGGLIIDMIPQNEIIQPGGAVCTSGLEGDYPRGLVLGEIESVKSEPNELFQKATVRSQIDFKKLEIVFIALKTNK
jgi:rod shape-determining protein MreC